MKGKIVILFFPHSSIRTRVNFENEVFALGGQPILFPNNALDKKVKLSDVVRYLNNWADCIVVQHNNIDLITEMSNCSLLPIINAMTSVNHPCEVLSDLYSLSKIRPDYLDLNYTFVGSAGNIGYAWVEAAKVFGLNVKQCCPIGYEMEGVAVEHDILKAMSTSNIMLTDSSSSKALIDFSAYRVTCELMKMANEGALLNPCPPFFRGEEISADVI